MEEYRVAVALNPSRVEPRVGLGSVLGRMGRSKEALAWLSAWWALPSPFSWREPPLSLTTTISRRDEEG